MRSLCKGKAFAEKGVDLDIHEWANRARQELMKDLADWNARYAETESKITYRKDGTVNSNCDYLYEADWIFDRNIRPLEELIESLPSREPVANFVAVSGYHIRDMAGHYIGIAIKVEETDRTGSWKDSRDWWWSIRPDGRSFKSDALYRAAWKLLKAEEEEVEKRRLQRLDDEALAEVV